MDNTPVVMIVGAGPTGLMLSLWLQKFSVPHRLIDAAPSAGTSARAVVLQARSLEFYRQLGLDQAVIAIGTQVNNFAIHHDNKVRTKLPMIDDGWKLSKYPYVLTITQDEHEALLERTVTDRGGKVERNTKMVAVEESSEGNHVNVTLEVNGRREVCTASYVIGCDGAHSAVRRACDIDMVGGTYNRSFYVADVIGNGHHLQPGQMNMCLSQEDFTMIIPLPHKSGRARLIGFLPKSVEAADPEKATFDDVAPSLHRNAKHFTVEEVNWFSRYKIHHRTAATFQRGRVFLCGDAAHIHSPVGGQGMNTGLGDAVNLAWKIAAVHQGAPASLLDSYEPERMAFAKLLVATTDFMFTTLTGDGYASLFLRNFLIPYVLPLVARFVSLGPKMLQRASQVQIEYRNGPISANIAADRGGNAGNVQAGDRLPWVADADSEGHDNYGPLCDATWQAHVYGTCEPWVEKTLKARAVPLYTFPWTEAVCKTGLGADVLYLVRPDGHVGLVLGPAAGADQSASEAQFEAYLNKWGIGKGVLN